MLRYCLNISLEDHKTNEEITTEVRVMVWWYRHVRRRGSENDIWRVSEMTVKGVRPRGRPKQRLCDTINSDLRWLDLNDADAEDAED